MSRQRISQGSSFERRIGYSRAVLDGRWVFVSGTTGYDYTTMTISDDVVEQCRQTLANIDDALTRAGSRAADVVRCMGLGRTLEVQSASLGSRSCNAPPTDLRGCVTERRLRDVFGTLGE